MTRSKVLDEQRKRIGQACKGCQNRKQKCDGQTPCSGCEKRGHVCVYDPPRKRKNVPRSAKQDGIVPSSKGLANAFTMAYIKPEPGNSPPLPSPLGHGFFPHASYHSPSAISEWSNASEVPYESAIATRIPNQNSVSICGSSSASFLADIKRLILPISGSCHFTQSHDNLTRLGSNAHPQGLPNSVPLPDRDMAEQLVKLARQYSIHLVDILDEVTIHELLQTCYSSLPPQDPGSLCLLYLLFAAGSATLEAQKTAEYPDSGLVLSDHLRQADDYFYFAEATLMRIGGFDTFEVWMIQAWALMTTYSLAASKWNAADAYIGLAVRAAAVLGINQAAQGSSSLRAAAVEGKANAVHSKLWKCLFVLDSLVAALLGRQPQALTEQKCKPVAPGDYSSPSSSPSGRDECLEYNVASAKMIRKTIKLVYNQRHFPAERASTMLQQAQQYSPPLSPVCKQEQPHDDDAEESLATQHALLFRDYAKMLLSRPFFVQELCQSSKQKYDTTWKYISQACVFTAHQAVERMYEAHNQSRQFQNDYMWRPCLHTAVLVILTNQFFDLYKYENSDAIVGQAFFILELGSPRNPTEEGDLNSLYALRRLVDERKRRSLPMGRPTYLEMPPPYGNYEVQGDGVMSPPAFPTHDFAAAVACPDSTYCGPDGRRYSVQSMPSSDYLEPATGVGIGPLSAWGGGAMPGINLARCGSDAACYGFAVQQDGYDGDAMQVTQDYAAYPGQQLYLS